MSIVKGSPIKILIALVAIGLLIGLLLVHVVSAGIPFQNFGKVFTSPIGKPNVTKITRSPIDYSYLVMPFGFTPSQPHIVCDNNGLCYDENSNANCISCDKSEFPTIQYPIADTPVNPIIAENNTFKSDYFYPTTFFYDKLGSAYSDPSLLSYKILKGTIFTVNRDKFHLDYSECV